MILDSKVDDRVRRIENKSKVKIRFKDSRLRPSCSLAKKDFRFKLRLSLKPEVITEEM